MSNRKFSGSQFKHWITKPLFLAILVVIIASNFSCSTQKCAMCDLDNTTIYNVELKEGKKATNGKTNFLTYFAPVPIESTGDKVNVYLVDCEGKEPYLLKHGRELEKFVKENMLAVDSLDIKRITKTSDADIFPEAFSLSRLKEMTNLSLCQRNRNSFKIEIRAMLGFRSFDSIAYESIPGDKPIENKFIGFGPEGTKITTGAEISLLPTIATYNEKHRLHLGLMTGFWPVDGGKFIPLSIHPRFTFNDITNPLFGNCNALYFFGDLGTAYDITGDFDKFWTNNKLSAYFWGLGTGVDFWKTSKMDFSFDLGYRQTTLPLPSLNENGDWADCIEQHGISYSAYPRRRAGQFFIRFGITF